jgi:CheY-like chemotaxis protein
MNKIEIMVAGHNEQRLQTAALSLEANFTCIAITANGVEAAIDQFYRQEPDIIILDHDLENTEVNKLQSLLGKQNRDLVWARLQTDENPVAVAEQALEQYYAARQPEITVQDDALATARFNITIIE